MAVDHFGRKIDYMRISLTDRCNLRCSYCMPDPKLCPAFTSSDSMTTEDVDRIIRAGAALGIKKIRLTGGEPMLRSDILEIVENAVNVEGIESVCLTTNGTRLMETAKALKERGLDRINLSLDTLDPEHYAKLTRVGKLDDVLGGLEAIREAGFQGTKINSVLLGGPDGLRQDEIAELIEMTRNEDISVRFIELMPMGECTDWPEECFIKNETVLEAFPELEFVRNDGVSHVYQIPGYRGTVGFISPMSHTFCSECNRIRVTSDGKLKPCLHSAQEIDLQGLNFEETEARMREAIGEKPQSHQLNEKHHSDNHRNMNQIGG